MTTNHNHSEFKIVKDNSGKTVGLRCKVCGKNPTHNYVKAARLREQKKRAQIRRPSAMAILFSAFSFKN